MTTRMEKTLKALLLTITLFAIAPGIHAQDDSSWPTETTTESEEFEDSESSTDENSTITTTDSTSEDSSDEDESFDEE